MRHEISHSTIIFLGGTTTQKTTTHKCICMLCVCVFHIHIHSHIDCHFTCPRVPVSMCPVGATKTFAAGKIDLKMKM